MSDAPGPPTSVAIASLGPARFAALEALFRSRAPNPDRLTRRLVYEAVPFIEEALCAGNSDETADDVVARIFAGEAQLWTVPDAVLVTEITDQSEGRTIHAWLAAGDLEIVGDLGAQAEMYGRSLGCVRATINGRPGWGGFTRRRGYRPTRVLLEKVLG